MEWTVQMKAGIATLWREKGSNQLCWELLCPSLANHSTAEPTAIPTYQHIGGSQGTGSIPARSQVPGLSLLHLLGHPLYPLAQRYQREDEVRGPTWSRELEK